ncbi:unnamed protein product [Peronospora belbahrii]|uniref:glutamine synthetase n=1 Tax=Peronospora belbahrii TaxID=622444 RepID=A0ABN8CW69_9STRA|nr:unnamed protein product [Peronospora belbahrii]
MSQPLDRRVYDQYMSLDTGDATLAEYVWIGGSGQDLRCKTKTLTKEVNSLADLPIWNFDGSSTGQAPGEDSEVLLRPVAVFKDPFRRGKHILVLCECLKPDMTPIANNTRADAARVMEAAEAEVPWFGIEQEYTLFEKDGVTPYGWPKGGFPGPQGPYYCGAGAHSVFGRLIVDAHYRASLYAGINISGINAEVMPGQWEYQETGMVLGVTQTTQQKAMREEGGMTQIIEAIEKMKLKHKEHIAAYGTGNERRLTGRHETASMNTFSYGVANRGASIRIPRVAEAEGKGYFEDRRPASNMDPVKKVPLDVMLSSSSSVSDFVQDL